MKLRCPKCQKALSVPDELAGKAVRCPECKSAIRAPRAQPAAVAATPGVASMVDLDSLAKLESRSAQMGHEELAAAQSDAAARQAGESVKGFRTCPKCNKQTLVADPRVEVLCSHCWEPIPGIASDDAYDIGGAKLVGHHGSTLEGTVQFYDGLATALLYPGPAIGSILVAVVVAIVTIFMPIGLMTAVASAVAQSDVGTEGVTTGQADLTMVSIILQGIFALQLFAFACVGMTCFFDAVRTTSIGEESPPSLSWNPNFWGRSAIAVIALGVYYAIMEYLVVFLAVGPDEAASLLSGSWIMGEEVSAFDFLNTGVIVGLVIVQFLTPMNLIGMSLGSVWQGLNPIRVIKSIGRTHVHYLFLVILLCVYGAMGMGGFLLILEWFIPKVQAAAAGSKKGAMGQLGIGLVGWGAMMGFTFYLNYVLGRVHGLFARTYRKKLDFGEA